MRNKVWQAREDVNPQNEKSQISVNPQNSVTVNSVCIHLMWRCNEDTSDAWIRWHSEVWRVMAENYRDEILEPSVVPFIRNDLKVTVFQ